MGITSEHFSEKELACHHCGVNNCTEELVEALEAFRKAVGKPIIVDSAYRCAVNNAAVGGAKSSQHLLGNAADIRVKGMTAAQLERIAHSIHTINGIGRNDFKQFLHIDVRRHPAQWCYNAAGKDVAYYPPLPTPTGTVNA